MSVPLLHESTVAEAQMRLQIRAFPLLLNRAQVCRRACRGVAFAVYSPCSPEGIAWTRRRDTRRNTHGVGTVTVRALVAVAKLHSPDRCLPTRSMDPQPLRGAFGPGCRRRAVAFPERPGLAVSSREMPCTAMSRH